SIFEGRNFGQPVAQVAPGITVLVKQKGVPAGINGKQRHSVNADALYEASLERAAALPPAAYECLVEDVMFLHEREKAIDPSKPGNVLIDLENGRFNFVDIGQGKAYPEDIESLYVMLTTRGYGYKGNNAETVREMKQQIMDKLITAYE